MITDAQFASWLEDNSAQRVTLFKVGVNVGGVDTTRYLSNRAYGGGDVATPYRAVVAGGLKMVESVSLVADATFSAGAIELYNVGGELDSWLDDVWVNQAITAWVGDVRWPEADFRPIFVGVVEDIDGTKKPDRLNLLLADKLKRLDASVTDEKMGAGAPNPDTLRRKVLGEVHNLTPKVKNAIGDYEFNAGDSERLIEVRTDGRPREVTVDLATGSFKFTTAVGPGAVTCSVQGVKPAGVYSNRIAPLIKYLVTQCGKASSRFVDSDLDLAGLAAFDASHPQAVGLDVAERMNVIEACHQLAGSVGAQMLPSRGGLLRLVQIAFPSSAATEIRASRQVDRTIQLVAQTEVKASITLGYCRNHTPQPNLQTLLPDSHKELFANEWLTVTSSDPAVLAAYKLDAAPAQENTCLQVTAEAQAEADRRRDIFKVKRKTYQFEGTPGNMLLELGQPVKLFSNRYNLIAGKVGVVTYLAPDWDNFHVTVQVTI